MAFIDWETDNSGDWVFSGGDFKETSGRRAILQDILMRVKTAVMDYKPNLDLGAGLDEYIGKPNSANTGRAIEDRIKYSLTRDGRYDPGALKVDVVPHGEHELGMYLFVSPAYATEGQTISVTFTFNLISGAIFLLTD